MSIDMYEKLYRKDNGSDVLYNPDDPFIFTTQFNTKNPAALPKSAAGFIQMLYTYDSQDWQLTRLVTNSLETL